MNSIRASSENSNPSGLCQCGCGQPAPIAKITSRRKGTVQGQPKRFIAGHYHRRYTSEELFWQKVDKSGGPDACWIWHGSLNHAGYGRLIPKHSRAMLAHRYSWTLVHGPIPPGLFVCHRCDNPPCVNPAHLWLGTNADNMRDSVRKGRMHPGERHYSARLTEAQVRTIRARHAAGERVAALAREYGISGGAMSQLISGITWKHVR